MQDQWWWKPWRWIGSFLSGIRRLVLNVLTVLVLVGLITFAVSQYRPVPTVPHAAVLQLHLVGSLRNVRAQQTWEGRALDLAFPSSGSGIVVRHLLDAIDHAASDPKIQALDLNLSDFTGGSLTQLDQVARALAFFRQHHKPIFAYAPTFSNASYLLASQANQIVMPKLGYALLSGFSTKGLYFKGLLDKLGVNVYAFRQGKYKSAVEPLTRDNMSHPARVENLAWLHVWWHQFDHLITQGRHLPKSRLTRYVTDLPQLVSARQGNAASLALQEGLITKIGNHEAFEHLMAASLHSKVHELHKISWRAYLAATKQTPPAGPEIAVVPIDGMLMPGNREIRGVVSTGPTVAQLRSVLHNSQVKAVVLQMDSPGGAVTTANTIRRELLKIRNAGKPVVVSMGSLGASGAYWLSTAANAIYAHPTTLAADIGVFVLIPNYAGLLHKLGVGYSGVSVPAKAPVLSSYAPLTKAEQLSFQAVINHIYGHFVGLVAKARHLPIKRVFHIAQGRAWSGLAAYHLGLVNGLGGMNTALAKAAKLAHLAPGTYRVQYLRRPAPPLQQPWTQRLAMDILPYAVLGNRGHIPQLIWQGRELLQAAKPYGIFSYLPVQTMIR